jgi:hypothetical protein
VFFAPLTMHRTLIRRDGCAAAIDRSEVLFAAMIIRRYKRWRSRYIGPPLTYWRRLICLITQMQVALSASFALAHPQGPPGLGGMIYPCPICDRAFTSERARFEHPA